MKIQPYRQLIRCESDRAQAVRMLQSRRIDEPQEVIIRQYVPDHSGAQQRFYRVICRELGDALGYTPDEMANIFKERFLVPILWADTTKTRFRKMATEIGQVRELYSEELAQRLKMLYISQLSTTELNQTQMSEYIDACLRHAAEMGVVIETPEELRNRRKTTTNKKKGTETK